MAKLCVILICVFNSVFGEIDSENFRLTNQEGMNSFIRMQNERFDRLEHVLKEQQQENIKLTEMMDIQKEEISRLQNVEKRLEILEKTMQAKQLPNHEDTKGKLSILNGISKNAKREYRGSRLLTQGHLASNPVVAFYAYLSQREAIANPHHVLPFDHVVTNIGNAYNRNSGSFVIPTSGVYFLSYTAFPDANMNSYGSVEIAVNGVSHGAIFVDSSSADNDWTGCTGNAILYLNQGDICNIRTHGTYQSHGYIFSSDSRRSTFSGFLISQ